MTSQPSTKLVIPSKDSVTKLIKGFRYFHPDKIKEQKTVYSSQTVTGFWKEGQMYKAEYDNVLEAFTQTNHNLEKSYDVLLKWQKYHQLLDSGQEVADMPPKTVPQNLDELLSDTEKVTRIDQKRIIVKKLEREAYDFLETFAPTEEAEETIPSRSMLPATPRATPKKTPGKKRKKEEAPVGAAFGAVQITKPNVSLLKRMAMQLGLGINPAKFARLEENVGKETGSFAGMRTPVQLAKELGTSETQARHLLDAFQDKDYAAIRPRRFNLIYTLRRALLGPTEEPSPEIEAGVKEVKKGVLVKKKTPETKAPKITKPRGFFENVRKNIGHKLTLGSERAVFRTERFLRRVGGLPEQDEKPSLMQLAIAAPILIIAPVVSFLVTAIAGLTAIVLTAIVTPIVAGTIIGVSVIALILFIINSGAYIVPPKPLFFSGDIQSAYIGVVKTASPNGPFENSEIPLTVTYTIKVTAKKGSLTNISLTDECRVIKKGAKPSCPTPANIQAGPSGNMKPANSFPPTPPSTISPTEDYVIIFDLSFSSATYHDSLIVNTITVTADADESKQEISAASENIIIGNPPTECFVFDSGQKDPNGYSSIDWSEDPNGYSNIFAAIGRIGRSEQYMALLCDGGKAIHLYRVKRDFGGGWASGVNGGSIFLYNGGTSGFGTAAYTLAHETGHILNWRRGDVFNDFAEQGISKKEGFLHTYPIKARLDIYEDFAETIGLYVGIGVYRPGRFGDFSYPDRYPLHYNFAKGLFGIEY